MLIGFSIETKLALENDDAGLVFHASTSAFWTASQSHKSSTSASLEKTL
jgi:hypothetical protein